MRRDTGQTGHQAADPSPRVVISLDFELLWGMRDVFAPEGTSAANLEQVRGIVPELLSALTKRNLRATWATVGALGCADWADYFARAPASPHYANVRLVVDEAYAAKDPVGRLHFAPELLDRIHEADGQDLGTHTFSHLMLGEPGVTSTDLEADLGAVAKLWVARFGAPPVSLVFPRNHIAFLDVVAESSVRVWRGRERARFDSGVSVGREGLPLRIARLVDTVNPLARKAEAPKLRSGMLQTRASLFVRPGLPGALWAAHKRRIAGELRKLGSGEMLHLWLHPHNFVTDQRTRLSRFDEVLDMVAERVAGTAARSVNMADLVAA